MSGRIIQLGMDREGFPEARYTTAYQTQVLGLAMKSKTKKLLGILALVATAVLFQGCAGLGDAIGQGVQMGIDGALAGPQGDDGTQIAGIDPEAEQPEGEDFSVIDTGGPTVDVRVWNGACYKSFRFPRGNVEKFKAAYVGLAKSHPIMVRNGFGSAAKARLANRQGRSRMGRGGMAGHIHHGGRPQPFAHMAISNRSVPHFGGAQRPVGVGKGNRKG